MLQSVTAMPTPMPSPKPIPMASISGLNATAFAPTEFIPTEEEINSYTEVPLTALSRKTRRQLSDLLNPKKILPSEEGHERDWRGIAALAELKVLCDDNSLAGDNPMSKVIDLWCMRSPATAMFVNLMRFLGIIDRWDVSDDIQENLVIDAKCYIEKMSTSSSSVVSGSNGNSINHRRTTTATDDADISSDDFYRMSEQLKTSVTDAFGQECDEELITLDDVECARKNLPPQKYDAFVLYADENIEYVEEMLRKLEDDDNFKLCLRNRVLGGKFEQKAVMELIEKRCNYLIVILTKEFLNSPENTFLVDYTQAYQTEIQTRKIIPLIYDDLITIPRTLKIYTHLRYNRKANGLYNFWAKLAASIRNVSNVGNVMDASSSSPSPLSLKKEMIYNPPVLRPLQRSTAINSTSNLTKLLRNSASMTTMPMPPSTASLSLSLPTPPSEIPSININGHAFTPEDEDVPKKKERRKFKKPSSFKLIGNGSSSNKMKLTEGPILRHAVSTSQLNAAGTYREKNSSLSDLSTTSACSDTKKKRKWTTKLFKRVFSRSSTKLQEPAC